MVIRLLPVALVGLLAIGAPALAQPSRVAAADSSATSLDRYVATPDPAYRWSVVSTRQEGPLTVTTIEMTSQSWLTAAEVDRPEHAFAQVLGEVHGDPVFRIQRSDLLIAPGAEARDAGR